jgi:bacteriocin biosynthesis cyclodehydratase domain-containing protein
MRPTLLPNLRRLWRDAHTVQLGTDPSTAVVLEFAEPSAVRLLDLLDGSYTEAGLVVEAESLGLDEHQVRSIVATLRRAGLVYSASALVPAGLPEAVRHRIIGEAAALGLRLRGPTGSRPVSSATTPAGVLRRRGAAHVLVAGDGPLVAPVAAALAAAGVRHVDPAVDGWVYAGDVLVGGLQPEDVNRSRAIAIAAAVRRAAPGTDVSPVRGKNATVMVRIGTRLPAALATRGVRARQLPRLDVTIRQGVVVVGPFVRPAESPCLGCLDLHRRDRDPAWPALAAQLATARDGDTEPCALTTALAGAAFVADEVLAFIDGTALRTEAATVEITRPGEQRRRTWSAHPHCDCRRRRADRQVRMTA